MQQLPSLLTNLENFADIALQILQERSMLAVARDENDDTGLHLLARKTCGFSVGDQWYLPNQILNSSKFLQSLLPTWKTRVLASYSPYTAFHTLYSHWPFANSYNNSCVNIYSYIIQIYNK